MQFIQKTRKLIDEGLKVKKEETELMVIKVMSYYIEMSIDQTKAMELRNNFVQHTLYEVIRAFTGSYKIFIFLVNIGEFCLKIG